MEVDPMAVSTDASRPGPQPVARIPATPCRDQALSVREITPQAVTLRLSRRLRDLIGPGRRWSYVEISARTLIDVRTLKAYVNGTACPNLAKYKRLVATMGPEVAMDLNRMLGWEPRAGREPPEALDLAALEATLLQADQTLGLVLGQRHGDAAPLRASVRGKGRAAAGHGIDTLAPFRRTLPATAITPRAIADRLSFRLKRMLRPEGPWSIAALSQATGISRVVIEAYVAGTACPNLARYFRMERVLGQQLGIEFALMLGWQPRYGLEQGASHATLDGLRSRIRACLAAISRSLL
jgi:hypothetical protein